MRRRITSTVLRRKISGPPIGQKLVTWRLMLAAGPHVYGTVAGDMRWYLAGHEGLPTWKGIAWACLGLFQEILERRHSETLPEMACQRSGRCCFKQVPRVSVFELERIANAIVDMPEPQATALAAKCRMSVETKYTDPILGEGVPCPLLEQGEDGKHRCSVHSVRPVICWASGLTTPLSWDCPIWQVHKDRFPTLPQEEVQPFLALFAWCRSVYARDVLKVPDNRQMMLAGVGVMALLGERSINARQPEVTAVLPHASQLAEDLWERKMEPPPEVEEETTSEQPVQQQQ
jgi:Fe-S-cluster containining protein